MLSHQLEFLYELISFLKPWSIVMLNSMTIVPIAIPEVAILIAGREKLPFTPKSE